MEGEDVVQLLQEALARKKDSGAEMIEVCAILNDTTGCLMSCAWKEPKCRIGLIVGTGTNACYLEDIDNVGTWDGDDGEPREGRKGEESELHLGSSRLRIMKRNSGPSFKKIVTYSYLHAKVKQR